MQTHAPELHNWITTENRHCQAQAVNQGKGQKQDRKKRNRS